MHREFPHGDIPIREMTEFYRIREPDIPRNRPYVWSMFVLTADGIGSFKERGYHDGNIGLGGPGIAGKHLYGKADEMAGVRGDYRLLQFGWAVADAILGDSGIIKAETRLIWQAVQEDLIEYRKKVLEKPNPPVQIVMTGRGLSEKELGYRIFNTQGIRTIIATSEKGLESMEPYAGNVKAEFETFGKERVDIPSMLTRLRKDYGIKLLDLQGGSSLMGEFAREFSKKGLLDEYRLAHRWAATYHLNLHTLFPEPAQK